MSVQALPLNTQLSQRSQKTSKATILKAQFGDGYEQRMPDGINYKKDTWTIVWDNLTNAQVTTVEAAMAGTRWGADYFLWTPFNEALQKKFKYDGHSVTYQSGNVATVQMQMVQVFDL